MIFADVMEVDVTDNGSGVGENMEGTETNRTEMIVTGNRNRLQEGRLNGKHWTPSDVLCISRSWVKM